jgi:hypothetical protein
MLPHGGAIVALLIAVTRPLAFTVGIGMVVADPTVPGELLTVARVAVTDPVPVALTSPVRAVIPAEY